MLPPLVPETSASTNSATSAGVGRSCDVTTLRHRPREEQPKNVTVETSFNGGRLDGLKGQRHNADIKESAVDDGPCNRISEQSQ